METRNILLTMSKTFQTWYNTIVLCVVLLTMPLQIMAFDWTNYGRSIEEIAVSSTDWTPPYTTSINNGIIPDETKTVLIYNVRTGMFLQVGGNWGVSATLSENGMRCWIEEVGTYNTSSGQKKVYKIHSVYRNYGQNIAGRHVLTDKETLSADRGVGVQGGEQELWEWCIDVATDNTYYIYRPQWVELPAITNPLTNETFPAGRVYLTEDEQYKNAIFAMNYDPDHAAGTVHYQPILRQDNGEASEMSIYGRRQSTFYNMTGIDDWKFISIADIKDAMDNTNATNGLTVDVTYLMNDDSFYRTNTYHVYGEGHPFTAWNWTSVANQTAFEALTGATLDAHKHDAGFDFVSTDNHESPHTDNIGGAVCDGEEFGKYYCAMMNNNGVLWQEVTVPKAGWYSVSVKAAASEGDLLFCAKKSDMQNTMVTEPLLAAEYTTYDPTWTGTPIFGDEEWQKRSGMYLYEPDEHYSTVRIRLEAGETLVFGAAKLSNTPNTTYTAVDEFKLTYTYYESFVLDEDANDLDYLEEYSQNTNPQHCYLNRNLVAGNWNTIYLPINLTKAQFEEAFGEGSKLGQLVNGMGTVLYFDTNLEEDEDGIYLHRGIPYIIKVTNDPKIADGEVVAAVNDIEHFYVGEPYYEIKQVTFNYNDYLYAIGALGRRIGPPVQRAANNKPNVLQMNGSYKKQYAVEKGGYGKTPRCYTFNKGALTYYANGANLKGFRAWIMDVEDNQQTANARFVSSDTWTGSLDNTDLTSSEYTTYIDGVPAVINDDPEEPVFNVKGQRMPAGSLPKGVYVKNGKKFVVK